MVNKAIDIDMGKVLELGKGVKLLFTDKDINIKVPKGRMLCSLGMDENHGDTKDGLKTYLGVLNRQPLKLNGDLYNINFYLLKHKKTTTDVDIIDEKANTKAINEM